VVKVVGTSSRKHYPARVDVVDDAEFECVFLPKVSSKIHAEDVLFLPNSQDQPKFTRDYIMDKLPKLKAV